AEGAPPSGSLEMYLDAGSALWTFAGVTPPHAGQLAVNARIRAAQDWLTEARLEANWSLTATSFDYPGLPAPLSGTLAATSRVDRNHMEINDLAATFTGGLAPDWSTKLTGLLEVESLAETPKLNGTLSLESGGKTLSLADWGLPGATLAQPSLSLATRLDASMGDDGAFELSLTLQEPATLSAASVALPGGVALPKATAITLATADQPFLRLARDTMRRLVADLALPLGKTSLTLEVPALEPKGPAERLILAMPAATLTAQYDSAPEPAGPAGFTAALDLKGAQIAVPTRGIALGAVAINAIQDTTGTKLEMTSGSVTGLGAFVPVRAEIEATLAGSATRFKARFRGIEQPLDLALDGSADLVSQKGEVEVKLAPLDFAVGGLQPYNFFPPLRSYFEDVSGRIEATGPVQFAKGKLSSALKLGIENFSGKVGPVHLINVNSVIEIDRPWPLSTRPNQAVAIELADVGLPLKDALFRFKVSNGTTMDVAESRLELAGGQVRLDPVTLNFDAPVHNLRLGVNQISVSRLFELVGIAGLSGEGSISGAVPVTIFPGGIAIPDAELRADAPGVLRYDRDQAPLALQSAGESVALALQALADFHYEELIVNLRRSLAGDVHLGLHISGRNPSFYDGYPVEFNLTVEGRLDQALREGLAGYQVPDMIQEQLENLTP
ncbi:MAG: YdbH domain-containing protein, partial [Rhodospirillaceae bacterium]|nr:YdbH domain-containing protein [Rhodospirillaceae bacterium]